MEQQKNADGTSHAGPKAGRMIEGVQIVISRGTPKQRDRRACPVTEGDGFGGVLQGVDSSTSNTG